MLIWKPKIARSYAHDKDLDNESLTDKINYALQNHISENRNAQTHSLVQTIK